MPVRRPRQNKVTPFGTIEASPHRGLLMGNRGDLHAPGGTLGRNWKGRRWISCILDGGGWKAPMDQPGHNYPLFFHDEAVALAAGHRPCGQCRPEALERFVSGWKAAHGLKQSEWLPLAQIDRHLHYIRVRELRHRAHIRSDEVPVGAFIHAPMLDPRPLLMTEAGLLPWQHGGYGTLTILPAAPLDVTLLTPSPIVAMLSAKWQPALGMEF